MLRTAHDSMKPRSPPSPPISSFHASDTLQSVAVAATRSLTNVARTVPAASRAVTTALRSRSVNHSGLNATETLRVSPPLSVSDDGETAPASPGSSSVSLHSTA